MKKHLALFLANVGRHHRYMKLVITTPLWNCSEVCVHTYECRRIKCLTGRYMWLSLSPLLSNTPLLTLK